MGTASRTCSGKDLRGLPKSRAIFGLVALLLAGAAAWSNRYRAEVRAVALMALLVFLILFGVPPMDLAAKHLWPLDAVVITRMYVYLAFAGAVGAGAAVSVLGRRRLPVRAIAIWAGVLVAAVGVVYAIEVASETLTARHTVREDAVLRFAKLFALGVICLGALGRLPTWAAATLIGLVCVLDVSFVRGYNVWLPSEQATPPRLDRSRFSRDRTDRSEFHQSEPVWARTCSHRIRRPTIDWSPSRDGRFPSPSVGRFSPPRSCVSRA